MFDWHDLLDKPYVWGARGPDAFDCYGLVIELHRRKGIILPDYPAPDIRNRAAAMMAASAATQWVPVERAPGTTVLLRVGPIIHCGVMVDDHFMVHTWEQSGGVVREPVTPWKRKTLGFYRYAG